MTVGALSVLQDPPSPAACQPAIHSARTAQEADKQGMVEEARGKVNRHLFGLAPTSIMLVLVIILRTNLEFGR